MDRDGGRLTLRDRDLIMPIFYECDRCTACCRWPGEVRLTEAEVTAMADFLGLSESAFIEEFTRLNWQRTGLTVTEQPGGACVFLDGVNCRVQPVKPQQCRDFPNLWNFPGFQSLCQARPIELSPIEWRDRIVAATGRLPPSGSFAET